MPPDALLTRAEETLTEATGRAARVVSHDPVGGGSIHRALRLTLADGRRFFLKHSPATDTPPDLFPREAEGLKALRRACEGTVIRVPTAWVGDGCLLLEWIDTGGAGGRFFADFGRALARMHRGSAADYKGRRFGFPHDNYLGSTPQANGWMDDWVSFWRERRLGYLLGRLRDRGEPDEVLRLGDRTLDRLGTHLDLPDEPACLLHGDLWSGNLLTDTDGRPVLVDPATYIGHREADLAMTHLFGGFGPEFYRAYEEEWPLPAGHRHRRPLYELYHLLNHLLLFGGSYRDACLRVLRRYA